MLLRALETVRPRKLTRPMAGLVERRQAELFDDTFVANWRGSEHGDKFFHLVGHLDSCLLAVGSKRCHRLRIGACYGVFSLLGMVQTSLLPAPCRVMGYDRKQAPQG